MTRTAYLAALREAVLAAGYPWVDQPSAGDPSKTKLTIFMELAQETITGTANLVAIDSPSFVAAWKAIGGKGKLTYKALRALPV